MRVRIPKSVYAEVSFTLNVLLTDILGYQTLSYETSELGNVEIGSENGKPVSLDIPFFKELENCQFNYSKLSLPAQIHHLKHDNFEKTDGLYGTPELEVRPEKVSCKLDILGSAFFFLSRWEELDEGKKDDRDRFPGTEAFAFQHGLLERPMVNEYAELLQQLLEAAGIQEKRTQREFEIIPSHDVDYPFLYGDQPWNTILKGAGVQLLKRARPGKAMQIFGSKLSTTLGQYPNDPYTTFGYILDQSEKHGRTSEFYFIAGHTAGRIDGRYAISAAYMKPIFQEIEKRGHHIGIHGSYASYTRPDVISKDLKALSLALRNAGVSDIIKGNRQHYLRIKLPETMMLLDEQGLQYDTSLGFADAIGFRCGTCTPFPFFDVKQRKTLNIYQRPLVLMECSLLDEKYMGLGRDQETAWEKAHALKDTCRKHKGQFTVLWHNHRFLNPFEKELYNSLIA